ncbi:hypothetical protein F0L68_19275 [Solihabitans fulvus]|uniref:Uncharacterized protein n=1 Tax=Solihabitans fulvus TaxID=1892852 RepID=A0A5B2XDA2_9PSEU|nr:hypothetical protein F0L68_19275 [Solihabitans fulvus]
MPAQLAETLRYGPFHRALREAIAHRGLSLARLRAHLDRLGVQVGQSTLSYWQRGLRHPEVPRAISTVRALETVLHLPANSLLVLIGPRHRPPGAERPAQAAFADLSRTWADTTALLAEFDAIPESIRCNTDLDVLSVHDTVLVGAQREQRSVTTRLVVRAMRSGPDRYLAVHQGDEGCHIDLATVRTAEGCRQGRLRRQPSSRGMVAELLFDRRLSEGEIHVFSFTVIDEPGTATPGFQRTFRDNCPNYLLQMGFHRRVLPARCTRQFRVRDDTTPVEADDLVCGLGGVVSAYFANVGPGLAGVAVEWT